MILQGVYAPIPTPFERDGSEEIAWGAYRDNLRAWKESPLSGVVVCGSNGELPFLDDEERGALTAAAKDVLGGGPDRKMIVTGTHQASARHAARCSKIAADSGADAVLVLPPHYFKSQGMPSVIAYFEKVADLSPVPVIMYNIPSNTGVSMDAPTILHLSRHPNIIGIKDSSGDVTLVGNIKAGCAEDFYVFCGSGNYLLPELTLGVSGGTLAVSNLYPGACAGLIEMFREGRMEEARGLQKRILQVSDAVTRRWGVPALKAAMDMKGLYGGPCRLPLLPLSDETERALAGILREADLDGFEHWRNAPAG